ncbi:MAG: TIM44-like domain-containing protein [Comamonas sp.]|jgi:predicted lipid-binding transport protein (Tim44 family)
MTKLWSVVLMVLLAFVHLDADAKRMGGGKSMGQQSGNVTQRQASPQQAPGNQAAPAQQAQRPATAAPQAAAKKPWGAMLGGIAAGLGLAWLAHSLGMGEAFANMLLVGLAIMAVLAIVGFIMRKKAGAAAQANNSPFAFQGAGNVGSQAPASAPVAPQYNPAKVGNDASARPWEHAAAPVAAAATGGSMIGAGLAGSQNWGVPEGFDAPGFLEAAKRNFVTLQSAWDSGNVSTLRSMMTDDMLTEVKGQLQDREQHREGVQPNQTDVVMLEAQLLGIEDLGNAYMASVEFSGMIREEADAGPSPFREVWNMTKPKDGTSGWLVAGLQALQ